MEEKDRLIKSGDAARQIGVTPQTLRNYEYNRILIPDLVYPSGHRKYSQKKIDCFIKEQAVI
jgi:DNA-binding transcriptional MerR regulator